MTNLKNFNPQPKSYKRGPYTIDDPNAKKVDGETIPRRNWRCKDGLITTPEAGITTLYDILTRGSSKFGNAKAVGFRRVIKVHSEKKKIKKTVDGKEQETEKTWTFQELGGYNYLSFIEFEQMALQAGAGLRKLGMVAEDRLHIFAATSPFWLAMAHGAGSQSMPIVTAYDTLGEEGLQHSLAQTHAKTIFLDPHLLTKLINPLKVAKDIQHVVYNSEAEVKQADIDKLKAAHPHLSVHSFNELRDLGKSNPVDPVPPKKEDLCCIMYTSGSTGTPKGVLLKHRNVVAAIAGVNIIIGDYLGPGDGLLAYLPLAHILEYVFENACLFWGGTMGYGNPRTLTDTSVRNCKGDLREFQPSILVGVPAVWETVKKGVMSQVSASNIVIRSMFWGALTAKNTMLSTGVPGTGILDAVVFRKLKEATGGKLRICMNGGGPISKETNRFISMAITPMIGGYGLTETACMGALMDPLAWTDNAIGEIPGSVEIKLVDCPDLGYFAKSNPPQGEIWIRGESVTSGYLDLEKENQEAFTSDGWFKSGDIGEFAPDGHLRVIDRKKNLVKTLNGEYIALEKLESVYRSSPVVANICVHAAQDKSKPVAIIVPAEPALKKLAAENGIKGEHLEDLVQSKKLHEVVLKEMQQQGKTGGLTGIEIIEGVAMSPEEWNPENGLTTSAQKLNRKGILQRYEPQVKQAYGNSG